MSYREVEDIKEHERGIQEWKRLSLLYFLNEEVIGRLKLRMEWGAKEEE